MLVAVSHLAPEGNLGAIQAQQEYLADQVMSEG